MDFFTSPKDLQGWVKSHESADVAAKELIGIIGDGEQQAQAQAPAAGASPQAV